MATKYIKGNCQKCGTAFLTPVSEIPLHVVEPGIVLCWKCCKEEHYWDDNRCPHCSEKTMCKGRFGINMSKQFQDSKGLKGV